MQEQAVFYKNQSLLNDCKITQEFIRLESRKNSYYNIFKLAIPNKEDKKLAPEIITEPKKIRDKMTTLFQDIFKAQKISNDKKQN